MFDSRIQRGYKTKAHSFSGSVVLVFEASQHSVPDILQQHKANMLLMEQQHVTGQEAHRL